MRSVAKGLAYLVGAVFVGLAAGVFLGWLTWEVKHLWGLA